MVNFLFAGRFPVLAFIAGDTLIEIGLLGSLDEAKLWLLEQRGSNVALNQKGTLEVVFAGSKEDQAQLLKC